MEWLVDPNIWAGLLTLIVLEIVLGIDNLIFIAILAEKLPPHQRDRARVIGLMLALGMRLILLTLISWLVTLTTPLFYISTHGFSGRDLILLIGGIFLVFKASSELHERLEGPQQHEEKSKAYTSFGVVIAQIVVLDAVFSLDAVITAVGMVEHLPVMMAAVTISILLMIWASRPLTRFVNAHPTVVVLCLSILLIIGIALIAEGFGYEVPKSNLYAAVGFSLLIEFFNQLGRRNMLRSEARIPMRDRTADAVMRLLSNKGSETHDNDEVTNEDVDPELEPPAFKDEERKMVSGVLNLSQRPLQSLMTPRTEITWVDIAQDREEIRQLLRTTPHSFLPLCNGELDQIIGVIKTKDLLADLADTPDLARWKGLRTPIIVHEHTDALVVIQTLQQSKGQFVMVVDEYGTLEGLLTPIDILEAIVGEFPDEDELPAIRQVTEKEWLVEGSTDLFQLAQALDLPSGSPLYRNFNSVASFMLETLDALPKVGDTVQTDGLRFEIIEMAERRVCYVRVLKDDHDTAESEPSTNVEPV